MILENPRLVSYDEALRDDLIGRSVLMRNVCVVVKVRGTVVWADFAAYLDLDMGGDSRFTIDANDLSEIDIELYGPTGSYFPFALLAHNPEKNDCEVLLNRQKWLGEAYVEEHGPYRVTYKNGMRIAFNPESPVPVSIELSGYIRRPSMDDHRPMVEAVRAARNIKWPVDANGSEVSE